MHRIRTATALAACLANVTVAQAYTGSGVVNWPMSAYGDYGADGGFGMRMPPAISQLSASYDSASGAVTIHARFYAPYDTSTSFDAGGPIEVQLGQIWNGVCAGRPGWAVSLTGATAVVGPSSSEPDFEMPSDVPAGQVLDADGMAVAVSFRAPWLAHQGYVCATDVATGWLWQVAATTHPPDDIFRIAMSAQDTHTVLGLMLPSVGINHATRGQVGRAPCSPTPATSVRCVVRLGGRRNGVISTGTLWTRRGDVTVSKRHDKGPFGGRTSIRSVGVKRILQRHQRSRRSDRKGHSCCREERLAMDRASALRCWRETAAERRSRRNPARAQAAETWGQLEAYGATRVPLR